MLSIQPFHEEVEDTRQDIGESHDSVLGFLPWSAECFAEVFGVVYQKGLLDVVFVAVWADFDDDVCWSTLLRCDTKSRSVLVHLSA